MDVWHTCPRASARPEGNFEGTREIVLTREGLARLEGELEQLATVRRREVAERISEALETGAELAENAEYLAAKEEQGRLEQRIAQLEERRAAATVVEAADVPSDSVAVGSRVRPKDPDAGETAEYEIVGSGEGSPTEGRLSSESPVGSAILDRHEGEVVEIEAPGGRRRLQILDVNPA